MRDNDDDLVSSWLEKIPKKLKTLRMLMKQNRVTVLSYYREFNIESKSFLFYPISFEKKACIIFPRV